MKETTPAQQLLKQGELSPGGAWVARYQVRQNTLEILVLEITSYTTILPMPDFL